jgi:pyridoxine kinase
MPLADVLTPNLFELSYLAGRVASSESEAVSAARSLGAQLVVVTSAPGASAESTTLLIAPKQVHRLRTVKFANAPHGTGDLLAALFLARLIRGEAPLDALAASVSSVHGLIGVAVAQEADRLPHIEHQEMLVAPIPRVEVEVVA